MRSLIELFRGETSQFIFFGAVRNFNGIAADFTVFDVSLTPWDRQIQNHGDFFAAIWAGEIVFHVRKS